MGKQHEAYLQFYRTANELHFDGKLTKEIEEIANRLELFEITPEQAVTELSRLAPIKATPTPQEGKPVLQSWSDLVKEVEVDDYSPADLARLAIFPYLTGWRWKNTPIAEGEEDSPEDLAGK